MSPRRISVVVNTDNRADSLRRTLEGLGHLDHPAFEVVVVQGPTPDHTDEVLEAFAGTIKVGRCAERNLSASRNLGVALAAGEIVAFIDDDAYPDPGWLDALDRAYDDPEVGGAGGPVWDWTGARLQVLYSIAHQLGDVWVENRLGWDLSRLLCRPHTTLFTYPIGTNASFRRNLLVDMGGFDEEFEYGWDDVDVCRRLIDRGWLVEVLEQGYVHHKSLPSAIRNQRRALHNLRVLLKNKAYYALKHGAGVPLADLAWNLTAYAAHYRDEIRTSVEKGDLEPADLDRYEEDVVAGYDLGRAAFEAGQDKRRPPSWFAEHRQPFLPFPTRRAAQDKLRLCFLTAEYPPTPLNGIGRVVHELASGLGLLGHEVHVLTRGEGFDRVDLEEDVWVHRLVARPHQPPDGTEVPGDVWDYAATLRDEALRIDAIRPLDLVQAPNWDAEGAALLLDHRLPLVLGLYTPLASVVAVDSPLALANARGDGRLSALVELERAAYRLAPHLLACGPAIVEEVERAYGITLDRAKVGFVAHGVTDHTSGVEPSDWPGRVDVLFVGRLEDRKGIDTLLEAVPLVLAACPDVGFTIVGDDTRPMADGRTHRQRFEARGDWPRLREAVRFLGRADDATRDRHYAGCDVFVAPSRFESFGLILLDAMMFAKPVVAARVGGMAEIVADGETGLLVEPGDAAALADAIVALATSPERRAAMGSAARRRFEDHYRSETMVEGANRFYDRVLGRSTAHAPMNATGLPTDEPESAPAPPAVTARPATPPPSRPPPAAMLRGFSPALAGRLRCPGCGGGVEVDGSVVTAGGEVKTGVLRCVDEGPVGVVEDFKPDFLGSPASAAPAATRVVPDLGERRIPAGGPEVERVGAWEAAPNGWLVSQGTVGDALVLRGEWTDARVRLWRHTGGGTADLFVDGVPVDSVDLSQREGSEMLAVRVGADLPFAPRELAVRARGHGGPVVVEEFVLLGPRSAGFGDPEPINRGNPYSAQLEPWLARVPPGEPVLEVGGGDRRRCEPGRLNLEFLKFELADLYGDVHRLPFADDTFAATWSQAVFEHLADPAAAAAELVRVTRPGGLVMTEVAFMQPLHAVPGHFFNMTPWGVAHLFEGCEVLECDWFGELSGTVEWLARATGLTDKVDPGELAQVLERFRAYDALISHEELRPAASAVYLVAAKPGGRAA